MNEPTSEVVSAESLPRFKDEAYMRRVAREMLGVPGAAPQGEPEGGYARAPVSGTVRAPRRQR